MIKKIFILILLVILAAGAYFYVKRAPEKFSREPLPWSSPQEFADAQKELERNMNSPSWKRKMAFEDFMAYQEERNAKNRAEGKDQVIYFPCPNGYDCEKLVPPRFRSWYQRFEFDNCVVSACMEILKKALLVYDVENVDEYLIDKKISER